MHSLFECFTGIFLRLHQPRPVLRGNSLDVSFHLDTLKIENYVYVDLYPLGRGRPKLDAAAIARAFVSKAVLNIPTTRALIDRLNADAVLRRICGFERRSEIPCEASFSNWFLSFASNRLAERIHEALVRDAHVDVPVHNVSLDSTAIEGRESPAKKEPKKKKAPKKRGRPRRGEVRDASVLPRLERQLAMSFNEQISDLPIECDHGFKTNAKGISTGWIGYKLHIDSAEGARRAIHPQRFSFRKKPPTFLSQGLLF